MCEKEQDKILDEQSNQEKILDEKIRRLEQALSLQKEQIRLLGQIASKKRYYVSD